jgi:hypothetical protein
MAKVNFVSASCADGAIYAVDDCGNVWSLDGNMQWQMYQSPEKIEEEVAEDSVPLILWVAGIIGILVIAGCIGAWLR